MQNNNVQAGPRRHIKPFWTITIVAVAAAIVGGIIYFYSQGNELQDEIYSISFTSPVQIHKQAKKLPYQLPAKTTTSTAITK